MPLLLLILAGVVLLGMIGKKVAGILPELLAVGPTARAVAEQLGIAAADLMTPKDPDTEARLLFTSQHLPRVLAILRQYDAGARYTSGWRPDPVNDAVGGVQDSRHRYGLAGDIGNGWNISGSYNAAVFLRDHPDSKSIPLRDVIAEDDHLHVEFLDPLGRLDGARKFAKFKWEISAAQGEATKRIVEI